MGSWNGTCGISHLPIRYKDPVKILIIKNGHYQGFHQRGGGFCGSDNLFQLVGIPLDGKYEDSGLPDEYTDNQASRWMHKHLKSVFTHKRYGAKAVLDPREVEDNIPEIAKDPDAIPLNRFIRFIERGGAWTVSSVHHSNEPYGVFLVHKFIWDQIIKSYHNIAPKEDDWYAKWFKENEENLRRIKDFIENFERNAPTAEPTDKMNQIWDMSSLYDGLFYRAGLRFVDLLEMLPKNEIRPEHRTDAIWMLDRVHEVSTVINYMTTVRRGLIPQFGAGSQEVNYEGHVELANWIQTFCKRRQKADAKEWGE